MKRISLFFIMAAVALLTFAQQPQKGNSIALKVLVEDMVEPFPATAKQQVENKLNRLLTQNGIASMDYLAQFFITAHAVPVTKDVIPGPPMQIAENMEITFYIADYLNQIVFATTTVTTKGVGTTDAKSYIDAIRKINLNSKALQEFVAQGKAKIIDYYDQQIDNMLLKAASLAKRKNYEEALFLMSTVPSECKKYKEAIALGDEIYQQYIDYLCDQNLALARTAWVSGQNAMAAEEAGQYLANIYPDAKCYQEAMALYDEIKAKVLDDWHFEMRKYTDQVNLEMARINSWRDVGVAYGKGQQPTTTNIGFLR